MKTCQQTKGSESKRINVQPHRLGMGWHYLWEYDPPIEHLVKSKDGIPCYWREAGETSEGCIMWLADCFAIPRLSITAREVYRLEYAQDAGEQADDDWLATQALHDEWSPHTVLPKHWGSAQVRKLFEDLEDVNYHSFLGKLIELVEQRAPELAARLEGWCKAQPKGCRNPSPVAHH